MSEYFLYGDYISCEYTKHHEKYIDKDVGKIMIELSRLLDSTMKTRQRPFVEAELALWHALASCVMYMRETDNATMAEQMNKIADQLKINYKYRFIKNRKYSDVPNEKILKDIINLQQEVLNMIDNVLSHEKYSDSECVLWRVLFLLYDSLIVGYNMQDLKAQMHKYKDIYDMRKATL